MIMTPARRSELVRELSLLSFHTFAEIARTAIANQQALIANFGEGGGPDYIFMSQLWHQFNDFLESSTNP